MAPASDAQPPANSLPSSPLAWKAFGSVPAAKIRWRSCNHPRRQTRPPAPAVRHRNPSRRSTSRAAQAGPAARSGHGELNVNAVVAQGRTHKEIAQLIGELRRADWSAAARYNANRCDCSASMPSKISESSSSCSISSVGETFQPAPPVIRVSGSAPSRLCKWRCMRSIAPVMA